MSNAVFFCTFNLKSDASVPDFLLAAEKLNNGHISKQQGYISWKQLRDGDTWADFVTFETMEDVKSFEANSASAGELAANFFSFINSGTVKVNYFTVERSY
ncbi:MAG: hypothetical protein FWB91_07280 [Defluviitaleaceae bacterium]|nr:hypothetical protein [Defluviitaleaceae bacterium]